MPQQYETAPNRARRLVGKRAFALPSTRAGWWAIGLAAMFWICLGVAMTLVAAGQRGGDTLIDNPWLSGTMLLALAAAIAGGFVAGVAVVWRGERSPLVFLALLQGAGIAVLALGEIGGHD
jgi:hypothetical protein